MAYDLEKRGLAHSAAEKYIELGNSGLTDAFYYAGGIFAFGRGDVERNTKLALKYYKIALSSDKKAMVLLSLGVLYSTEGSCDLKSAFKYFKALSELDDPFAQVGHYRLGLLYYNGAVDGGVDRETATYHFKCAAAMGHAWSTMTLAHIEHANGNRIRSMILRIRGIFLTFRYCFDKNNPGIIGQDY